MPTDPTDPTDLELQCSCGSMRWVARAVSAERGNRLVCYCDDCQSFAHFLGAADRVLDAHGGSDIFQTSPARVEFTEGADHLACMRLTPGGLLRWYADCCRTPIGNTLATRQVPFVGLIQSGQKEASAGPSRDTVLGPIRFRVHARFAKGDRNALDAHDKAPPSLLLRFMLVTLKARLRGDHVRSPFFDSQSGRPRVKAQVLSDDELQRVETARDS